MLGEGARLRRFAANALWLIVAQVAGKAASFLFVVVVARAVEVREFGYFSFAISFVPLFLLLGTFALDGVLVREIARDPGALSELFGAGLVVRCSLGLAGLALAVALAPLFVGGGTALAAVAIVGLALFLDELSSLVGAVFKAFEQMQLYALLILVNRLLSTALALGALALGKGLVAVCVTYLLGSLGALVFGAVALRRRFPAAGIRDVRAPVVRRLVQTAAPLGVAGVFNTAVFRVDAVMLQAIRGPVELGLYGAAYRFFETLLFATWALSSAALPRMSRAGAGTETKRTFELTAGLVVTFYLPIAVGAPFAAEWLMTTIFSARYADAAAIIPVLAAAASFYGLAYLARMGALALGEGSAIAWIAGGVLAVNVAGNLVAIPRWGFEGAAWTMLLTEAVEAALLLGLFARTSGAPSVRRIALVPGLAAGCMLGALLLSETRDGAALAVGALVYTAALAAFGRLVARDQLRAVCSILRPARG